MQLFLTTLIWATVLIIGVQRSYAAELPPLIFLVNDPSAKRGGCDEKSLPHCRDDLTLAEVFDALNEIAHTSTSSIFPQLSSPTAFHHVHVKIGKGTFRQTRPLALRSWPNRFGTIHIIGSAPSQTRVTGASPISPLDWKRIKLTNSRIGIGTRDRVWAAILPRMSSAYTAGKSGSSGFGRRIAPVELEVYELGIPMHRARWPDNDWAGIASTFGARSFGFGFLDLDRWSKESNAEVAGYFSYDWAFERIPVEGFNSLDGAINLQDAPRLGMKIGQRLYVENALSELDSPGEWYFDRPSGTLYYSPLIGGFPTQVEFSTLSSVFHFSDSEGIQVRDLTIDGTIGDAVVIERSSSVQLQHVVVKNAANRAVRVEGGREVRIASSRFSGLGEGAISMSGGDRRNLIPSGHSVEFCTIEQFSRLSRTYRPAISLSGVGIKVVGNRVRNGPHAAIIFDGNDHYISRNHISDVVLESTDAGAIYTGRDWTSQGTIIEANLVQRVGRTRPASGPAMGIYLDDQASGIKVIANVFANVPHAVFVGGGRGNRIEKNIFVNSSPAIYIDNRGLTWQRQMTLNPASDLRQKLAAFPADSALMTRYPSLTRLLHDELGRSKYNTAVDNLFIDALDFELRDGAETGLYQHGNKSFSWRNFPRLRGPKDYYLPEEFNFDTTNLFEHSPRLKGVPQ